MCPSELAGVLVAYRIPANRPRGLFDQENRNMQEKSFKATTIVTPDVSSRLVLEAAFNNWSEETKPRSILHVHYYHDKEAHVRGYQVVYEENRTPYAKTMTPKEDEPVRMLV
jgi:hypothetical protein